ncbi:hypothetical protein [Methanogenium cariaci]|jgi:hypothetical protein
MTSRQAACHRWSDRPDIPPIPEPDKEMREEHSDNRDEDIADENAGEPHFLTEPIGSGGIFFIQIRI